MSAPFYLSPSRTKSITDIVTSVNKWQEHLEPPTYTLHIGPLLDLQRQIRYPLFPNSCLSPSTINLHRQHLFQSLQAHYQTMKNQTLWTFYTRLRCPRCGQLPFSLPDSPLYLRGTISMMVMNHSLPARALELWRTLRREMEGVDLLQLNQGHMDDVLNGLREVERLFFENDQGGCGVEAWNGGRGGPPID